MSQPPPEAPIDLASDPGMIRLARGIAFKWTAKIPYLADEIESAALLGLVEAARSWREDGGASFKTHATCRIVGAIKDCMRNSAPSGFRRDAGSAPETSSMSTVIGAGEDNEPWTLGDTIGSDDGPVGWELDAADAIDEIVKELPPRHKDAIRLTYAKCPGTLKAAGKMMGCSESRISQLNSQGIAMLREWNGVDQGGAGNGVALPSRLAAMPGRKLDDADKAMLREIAGENPGVNNAAIADLFAGRAGWRPYPVAISGVINPATGPRKPRTPRPEGGDSPAPRPDEAPKADSDRPPIPAIPSMTAPAPVNPSVASALAELDACRAILSTVGGMDGPAAIRALRWAVSVMEGAAC